jgi:hypothetical protein
MATKRMKTYLVTTQWTYGGKPFRRRIAENALTPSSAKTKVLKYYNHPVMLKKLGKATIIAVREY